MNTRTYPRSLQEAFKDADYASPYCPGYADTSDPWFVRHEQIMDVALVLASVAAVAVAVMAIFLWGAV